MAGGGGGDGGNAAHDWKNEAVAPGIVAWLMGSSGDSRVNWKVLTWFVAFRAFTVNARVIVPSRGLEVRPELRASPGVNAAMKVSWFRVPGAMVPAGHPAGRGVARWLLVQAP